MSSYLVPVILSGGIGSRLWPVSRESYPKQFLSLYGKNSLLQDTYLRLPHTAQHTILVCQENHRFIAAEQISSITDLGKVSIMLEPQGRNTAPAIAVAAFHALERNKNAVLLVLPADHLIQNIPHFHTAIHDAEQLAEQGFFVSFGITPDYPETGYGYIQAGQKVNAHSPAHHIDAFIEKPNLEKAESLLKQGNFSWNSGMFCFRADIYLQELQKFQPEIYDYAKLSYDNHQKDLDFLRLDSENFKKNPSISIDYAIMEKTDKGVVIPTDLGWSDIGSWQSMATVLPADGQNNVIQGDVNIHDSQNCYFRSMDGQKIAAIGLDNIVAISTKDTVLICDKNRTQDVKIVFEKLYKNKDITTISNNQVHRPWGYYETLHLGERFQVKHIHVKAGASLSLQMHHHRAEHWVVVQGTAQVTRDDETLLLHENQSTFIPIGMVHRIKNPGLIPLSLIEIQSGSYLGEDDIARFEDVYKRHL